MRSVLARIRAEHNKFWRDNGFKPDRIMLTAEEYEAAAREDFEGTYPHMPIFSGVPLLYGMEVEIGERMQARFARIADFKVAA